LHAKRKGQTLIDFLHAIYYKYGVYYDTLLSVNFPETKAGKEQMVAGMKRLRDNLPERIDTMDVLAIEDYLSSSKTTLKGNATTPLKFPKTDMLIFWLTNSGKIVIRPSGTEPKIKIYCEVVEKEPENIQGSIQSLQTQAKQLIESVKTLLTTG
jgi:phosphoglucomutase/phosphomannomutase